MVDRGEGLLVAACPILTSTFDGPSLGTLVFVKPFDQEIVDLLQASINQPVTVTAVRFDEAVTLTPPAGSEASVNVFPDRMTGRLVLPALQSDQALVVETSMARPIRPLVVRSVLLFATALSLLALSSLGALWYFMERKVLRRINALVRKTRNLPVGYDPAGHMAFQDEIGVLRQSVDTLLQAIETAMEDNVEQQREILTILETQAVGIVLVDAEKKTVSWANSNALALMGRTIDEIRNTSCKETICPSQDIQECPVLDQGRTVQNVECTLPTSEGTGVPVLRSIASVTYNRRPHLLEVIMDLRPQKALESQLERARKLETVGLVAGGIAHDLNNLLTSLVGYPDMLLRRLSPSDPMYRSLVKVRDAGLRAGAIVEDLLTLARRGVKSVECFELGSMIQKLFSSPEFSELQAAFPGVQFVAQVQNQPAYCEGSPPHLEKALWNLVRNAAEAIPDTGMVTVSVDSTEILEQKSGFETVPPGRWLRVRVQDTGTGISSEDLVHIFEPFYSTKKMGRSGTGLGMTITWHAVKDMGGFLDVESEPVRGTCFTLYLPEASPPAKTQAGPDKESFPRGSGEKILVVEDMEDQRIIVKRLLTDLGYTVFTASNGPEALTLAAAHSFDLLILDVMLDEQMDGIEVYRQISTRHPGQKALIVTGNVPADRLSALEALGLRDYLVKPYSLQKLAEAVHTLLARPARDTRSAGQHGS